MIEGGEVLHSEYWREEIFRPDYWRERIPPSKGKGERTFHLNIREEHNCKGLR